MGPTLRSGRARRPIPGSALEDGTAPVVAEGVAHVHRSGFPVDVVAAFADKYGGWDVTERVAQEGDRVLLEIPVRRWLLAGLAQ